MVPITEFAKIVVASNGQQVLFYIEPDDETENEGDAELGILHMIASFDEMFADTAMKGIPMEQLNERFAKLGIKQADALLDKLKDLWGE